MSIAESITRDLNGLRVITDVDLLIPFSHDESFAPACLPLAVVEAGSTEEVQRVLRWASGNQIRVTPRGAGSGQSGGCVPEENGIVLSLARMKEVRGIDAANLIGVVQPGVITGEYQSAVEELNLFYPPDPASLSYCTLGGNVAENAGGPRALKYGVTRDFTLGLEVVLMSGERMRVGRQTVKGVAGYDVTSLFVGSEGTLGIITEITTALMPLPAKVATTLAFFKTTEGAAMAVARIIAAGIIPRTLEYMDAASIAAVRPRVELPIGPDVAAALLIEIDGPADDILLGEIERIAVECKAAGAAELQVANSERQRRDLWSARRMLSPALKETYRFKVAEDAVVPRSRLPDMVTFFSNLGKEIGVDTAVFGHAGDGNLHLNFLFHAAEQRAAVDEAVERLFRETIRLGGTITGEHGVGLTKKPYLPLEQAPELLSLQRTLKRALDPDLLLNPSKIFE